MFPHENNNTMKTKAILSTLLFILLCALCAAAKPGARADIVLADGSTIANVEIKLPDGWSNNVKYTDESGKEQKLDADAIDRIVFWHSEAPDSKALIKCLYTATYKPKTNEMDTTARKKEQWWMTLEAAGEHLSYWICYEKIKLSKKGISYQIRDYPHHFVKPSMPDRAFRIALNTAKPAATREWLCGFLADDPEMVKALENKGYYNRKESNRQGNFYNPYLYEQIVVDYKPNSATMD